MGCAASPFGSLSTCSASADSASQGESRPSHPRVRTGARCARALLLAALVLTLLPGCPEADTPTVVTQPFAGEEIRAGVPAETQLRDAWEVAVQDWAAETGAAAALDEIRGPVTPDGFAAHDLVVFPWTDLAALAAAGKLMPIPEDQLAPGRLDWFDHFQGLRENIGSWERQPVALPLSSPVLVCYLREDLLQQAGLKPPQTWDEYQTLLDKLPEWAPGLTAVEPWGEEFRATLFLARAVSYAKHPGHYSLYFDIESGAPLIDTPGFVRALDAARAAVKRMPPDVLTYGPAECRREFFAGRAALAITLEQPGRIAFSPSPAGAPVQKQAEASSADSTSARSAGWSALVTPLPGQRESYNQTIRGWEAASDGSINRVTLTGFGGLAVGVAAGISQTRAEACWNVVAYLLDPQQGIHFPAGTQRPVRETQLVEAARFTGSDLRQAEAFKYVNAVAVSLRDSRIVAELPLLERGRFRDALTRGVTTALTSDRSAGECLADVREEWSRIAAEVGPTRLRNAYRAALGLFSIDAGAGQ